MFLFRSACLHLSPAPRKPFTQSFRSVRPLKKAPRHRNQDTRKYTSDNIHICILSSSIQTVTVGTGIEPVRLPLADRGLYRQWRISLRPEDLCLFTLNNYIAPGPLVKGAGRPAPGCRMQVSPRHGPLPRRARTIYSILFRASAGSISFRVRSVIRLTIRANRRARAAESTKLKGRMETAK